GRGDGGRAAVAHLQQVRGPRRAPAARRRRAGRGGPRAGGQPQGRRGQRVLPGRCPQQGAQRGRSRRERRWRRGRLAPGGTAAAAR
ncbi:unnamed protein product, partial [Prorocentrum cordatum]